MTTSDIDKRPKFFAQDNVYVPHVMVIEKIIEETPGVRTFHLNFKDKKLAKDFHFESGQFAQYLQHPTPLASMALAMSTEEISVIGLSIAFLSLVFVIRFF